MRVRFISHNYFMDELLRRMKRGPFLSLTKMAEKSSYKNLQAWLIQVKTSVYWRKLTFLDFRILSISLQMLLIKQRMP